MDPTTLTQATDRLREAEAILITAGAGMGVDSGLPDFRGDEGFWRAYPPFRALGLSFPELANPRWFHEDARLAWGFYGHRLMLYRATVPHAGFALLKDWACARPRGGFVVTSNVDGQFQRAGFQDDKLLEIHGSIHHAQCLAECGAGIWSAEKYVVDVDPDSFRARGELPGCPRCGGMARPNVLMFGDGDWDGARTARQEERFRNWLSRQAGKRFVVVECGAGTAIPSIRMLSESVTRQTGGTLLRLNPREPEGPRGTLSLAAGAFEVLSALQAGLTRG